MATMKLLFLINILHKAPHDKFGKDNEQGWLGGGIPVWVFSEIKQVFIFLYQVEVFQFQQQNVDNMILSSTTTVKIYHCTVHTQ